MNLCFAKRLLIFVFSFICFAASAQDVSNKGRDFWIAYPAHVDGTTSQMGIYITSDVATSGTITAAGQTISFTLAANAVVRKYISSTIAGDIPNATVHQGQQDGIGVGGGIRVQSAAPVAVYAHIINSARSGATLVLPVAVWGKEYLVPSKANVGNGGNNAGFGEVAVMAAEANTTVEITPVVSSRNGSRVANTPYTITLANPGDVYQVQFQQNADITGTLVRSVAAAGAGCKPITVFSATTWSAFDCVGASGGDNLFQQLFPVGAFGRQFLTAPFRNRQYDIVRIIGRNPNTTVAITRAGVTTNATLGAGITVNTFDPLSIVASDPVSVIQYITSQTCSNGCNTGNTLPCQADPEMVVLSPVEQTVNNITVYSAHRNFVPGSNSNVQQCFLNIIIKTAAAASFKINGAAPAQAFVAIPGTNYSYVQADVSASAAGGGSQSLTADSAFSAIAYGYGNVESYGYNAGTNVRDLYQYLTIKNDSATVNFPATCVNSNFNYSITLPYQPLSLSWDFGGNAAQTPNANVSTNNPVADSSFVRDGRTLYVYRLPGVYNFSAAGSYVVKIVANNPSPDGCSGVQEINYTVNVFEKPRASFTTTTNGCLTDTVRFADQSISNGRTINRYYWQFGDGGGSTDRNPGRRYQASGSYNVRLLTVNDIGCSDDTTVPVVLSDLPVARLRLPAILCDNSLIAFRDSSTIASGTIAQYLFNNGNGVSDTTNQPPNRAFTYPVGQYTATLKVISSGGCASLETSATFQVNDRPMAGFTLPEVCLNDALATFADTSKIAGGSITAYRWTYGDATRATPSNPDTSFQQNGSHRYTAVGNYNVTQIVTSNQGCRDTLTQSITVNGATPKAAFAVQNNGSRLCANEDVRLVNNSTVDFGSITQVEIFWDLLGNPTQKEVDPTPAPGKQYRHRYPLFHTQTAKQFTVRMVAFSGGACSNVKDTIITVEPAPRAQLAYLKGICQEANPRLLTEGSDSANLPGTFAYSGTGVAANNFNPGVAGVGSFPIRYIYTTTIGCADTISGNIVVFATPTASLAVSDTTCARNAIVFRPGGSTAVGNLVEWRYNFGGSRDSVLTNGNPVNVIFPSASPISASLRILTDSGCLSNAATANFAVHPLPQVSFTPPASVCLPDGNATFANSTTIADGSDALLTYLWDFGDATNPTPSLQRNPTHRYSTTGPKTIRLIVRSNNQCVDSASRTFSNIYAQPLSVGTASLPELCVNQVINFNGLGSSSPNGSITSYRWQLADGGQSSAASFSYAYRSAGNYVATLQVTDDKNCLGNVAQIPVTVHGFPTVNAGPDLFVLEGGRAVIDATASGRSLRFRWAPGLYLNSDTLLKPITTPQADITYLLTVTGAGNCTTTDQVFVKRLQKPEIPNAFSPNGDGINDFWVINYLNSYVGCTVAVYNREGAVMFESRGYNKPWDGTKDGKKLPAGVYYYIVDPKNGLDKFSGSLTLLQ